MLLEIDSFFVHVYCTFCKVFVIKNIIWRTSLSHVAGWVVFGGSPGCGWRETFRSQVGRGGFRNVLRRVVYEIRDQAKCVYVKKYFLKFVWVIHIQLLLTCWCVEYYVEFLGEICIFLVKRIMYWVYFYIFKII